MVDRKGSCAVTFGSDAHVPEALADNFPHAVAIIEHVGFQPRTPPERLLDPIESGPKTADAHTPRPQCSDALTLSAHQPFTTPRASMRLRSSLSHTDCWRISSHDPTMTARARVIRAGWRV